MKLSPDSSSDTSSSKNVRILLTDEQSVKSSVRSHPSVSTRDSSEERKKVRSNIKYMSTQSIYIISRFALPVMLGHRRN